MKKSNVAVNAETIKQTEKAVQIKIEQGTFWFPRKNVEIENGVVIAVSKKMLAAKLEEMLFVKENNSWKQNGFAVVPAGRLVAETEKAVQIRFEAFISSSDSYGDCDVKMWFPKSLVQISEKQISIKAWAFLRACEEKRNYMGARTLDVHATDENGAMVRG
jgi:prolyl oligopeptidase PreP (S9A serine peptidase family)